MFVPICVCVRDSVTTDIKNHTNVLSFYYFPTLLPIHKVPHSNPEADVQNHFVVFLVPSRQILTQTLKLGKESFPPHIFQVIMH